MKRFIRCLLVIGICLVGWKVWEKRHPDPPKAAATAVKPQPAPASIYVVCTYKSAYCGYHRKLVEGEEVVHYPTMSRWTKTKDAKQKDGDYPRWIPNP